MAALSHCWAAFKGRRASAKTLVPPRNLNPAHALSLGRRLRRPASPETSPRNLWQVRVPDIICSGRGGWSCEGVAMQRMTTKKTALRSRSIAACAASLLSALVLCAHARADDLTTTGAGSAVRYRPDAFLTLDLSKALLSPIPLGPKARFEPLGIEAKTDTLPTPTQDMARAASKALAGTATQTASQTPDKDMSDTSAPPAQTSSAGASKAASPSRTATSSRGASTRTAATVHSRTRQAAARRHGNPLDAQAYAPPRRAQTHVQTWPCRSGGICGWGQ